ncbi:MAG: DUF4124 domain-containing protein [Nitrosomonadales bacterium]|nr:DUF4124 domain-containing protein [Nitrosomonadales bacterium]
MKPQYLFAMMCAWPLLVQADIYKSVDANGHVTYSSTPIKGGKKIILEPLPTMVPPGKPRSPADFPMVDAEKQKERDETRRKILQDELSAEEKLLGESQQNLNDASPEVFQGADGKTYRNVAKYEENIKSLTEQVELHQKNIAALKAELSKLK